jgi:hypothetical protein
MGEVYRARDTSLGRDVAIKILPEPFATDSERLARFEREARTLATLNHANIAAIYGLERNGDARALVMELVEGVDLSTRLLAGPIPILDALPLALQIANALEAAHGQSIVHRDLKPANIKVRDDGTVKVLDFGLAKAVERDRATSSSLANSPTLTSKGTEFGVILGTAAYMAPEQARGRSIDRRADVWALGAVLYEMLTGTSAFGGETVADVLASVMTREPDWTRLPADTPSSIRRLLKRCLEKDPSRRLRDVGDAAIEIQDALSAREEAPASIPATAGRPSVWPWVAGLAVAALAGAAAAIGLWPHATPPGPVRRMLAVTGPAGARRIVISPDGRWLAAPTWVSDAFGVYVRRVEDAEWHELKGVSPDSGIFWSPDSRQIGFGSGTSLKRVDLVGSHAQTICDNCIAPLSLRGATWNSSGDIVFAGGTADVLGGLSKIHETGGAVTSVTTADRSRRENSHRFPAFLPDGRHLLYTVRRDNGEHEIRWTSIDGGENHAVASAFSEMAYSGGYLLFVRDDALVAQAFDAGSGRASGDPVTVAAHVAINAAVGRAFFSVSHDGTVIFTPPATLAGLQWLNRRGEAQSVLPDSGVATEARVSRDGAHVVAAVVDLEKSSTDIYVFDVATGARTRLTSHPGWDESPIWSPDNHHVAYRANHGQPGLYVQSITGGDERHLIDQGRVDRLDPEDWSPDLTQLLVKRWSAASAEDLMLVSVSEPVVMKPWLATTASETESRFSPDGRFVAYVSNASGSSEVYVAPFADPSKGKRLTTTGGRSPVWSRDGRELFYRGEDQWVVSLPIRTDPAIEAGTPSRLFRFERGEFGDIVFDVHRDGRFLMYATERLRTNTELPVFHVLTHWFGLVKP